MQLKGECNESVIWHVYCEYIIILHNLQGTIILLQIDNFRVTDSTVPSGLDILTEFTIIFIVTVYFCISMSGE